MEHSYRYRLRFGGPIWLPKLPSIFPRVFENFQATDRSISHARRYRFPQIATGNRTILVSLSMFYAGHRWYMWREQGFIVYSPLEFQLPLPLAEGAGARDLAHLLARRVVALDLGAGHSATVAFSCPHSQPVQ